MKHKVVTKVTLLVTLIFISLTGFAYFYKPEWAIWQNTIGPATISYCELGNHPERYDGKLVRVKAPIAGENEQEYFLYNLDCDFGIEANMTALVFDETYVPDAKLKHWLNKLLQGETFIERKGHQAILTGYFNGRYSNGCWVPKYAMRVIKIEPIS